MTLPHVHTVLSGQFHDLESLAKLFVYKGAPSVNTPEEGHVLAALQNCSEIERAILCSHHRQCERRKSVIEKIDDLARVYRHIDHLKQCIQSGENAPLLSEDMCECCKESILKDWQKSLQLSSDMLRHAEARLAELLSPTTYPEHGEGR